MILPIYDYTITISIYSIGQLYCIIINVVSKQKNDSVALYLPLEEPSAGKCNKVNEKINEKQPSFQRNPNFCRFDVALN